VDSEYLPYAWYMTGDERARDVMREHAEAMARYVNRQAVLEHFRKDLAANVSRHTYVMVKTSASCTRRPGTSASQILPGMCSP